MQNNEKQHLFSNLCGMGLNTLYNFNGIIIERKAIFFLQFDVNFVLKTFCYTFQFKYVYTYIVYLYKNGREESPV